jgi:hypothetical protein
MGKVYFYSTLLVMVVAAVFWAVRLRNAKAGSASPAIRSSALFIGAGVAYPAICMISIDFALSGFVHHEGFAVVAAMMFLPLIGVGCGAMAILVTLFLKKLGASQSEKVQ